MAGEAVHDSDLGAEFPPAVVNAHFRTLLDQAPAQRIDRLETDDDDRVARVLDVVLEMMHNPAALAHAAGGDDDAGIAAAVELFALFYRLHIMHEMLAEQIGVVLQ